jgi:hypothetical protein
MTGTTFGVALEALKLGQKVKRRPWQAYLFMSDSRGERGIRIAPLQPGIGKGRSAPWSSNTLDILAEDWEILSNQEVQNEDDSIIAAGM